MAAGLLVQAHLHERQSNERLDAGQHGRPGVIGIPVHEEIPTGVPLV
jgi:hypothetical protein